jgi:hypothetical protein
MKLALVVVGTLTCMGFSSTAHAQGDPAAGKSVFNKCAVCRIPQPSRRRRSIMVLSTTVSLRL